VVPAGAALATWAAAWPVATVFVAQLVLLALGADVDDLTTGESAAAVAAGWIVFLAALAITSRTAGTGDFRADYALAFRPTDLLGIPAGFVLQLVALPALYWPLRELWPATFNSEEVEERATELVDKAHGGWIWVLAAVVVIGAPIVEELVYRGLLQRSLGARIGRSLALVAVALLFALIHFSPVEIPGLFLAGLAFGAGAAWTGRIGPGLVTHLAFNATGLAVVLWW
jgi:membrane protease YdiL (CAAX protease family)